MWVKLAELETEVHRAGGILILQLDFFCLFVGGFFVCLFLLCFFPMCGKAGCLKLDYNFCCGTGYRSRISLLIRTFFRCSTQGIRKAGAIQ